MRCVTPAPGGWVRPRWLAPALLLTVMSAAVLWAPGARAAGPEVSREVPATGLDERLQLGHNSPTLAAHPTDSSFMVLANRLDNPDFGCALQLSGDGGRSWIPWDPVPTLPAGVEKCYAPEVAFDRKGVLHFLFLGLAGQGNAPVGAYLATSGNRGRTFSEPRQVLGPERYMVRLAIDRSLGSSGRLHLVWLEAGSDPPLGGLAPPPNPIRAAWSDDGGRTFSPPVTISDPARRVVGPALAVGPDRSVHVLYYDLEDDVRDYQGLEGPTWEGTWSLHLASSTDGGTTFAPPVLVDDGLVPAERVILIFTIPPPALAVGPAGEVYAAWHDARNGDWDVFLRRSTDHGLTWSSPGRLSDDPVGSGRNQYLPRLSVAADGRLDAVFLDRRDDPGNVLNHTFLASSSDRGASFGPNLRITAEPSNSTIGTRYDVPSARGLIEFGSRLALLSLRDRALAAWPDTRNSELGEYSQDVYVNQVSFGGGDGGGPPGWLGPAAVAGGLGVLAVLVRVWRRRSEGGADVAANGSVEPTAVHR